MASMKIKLYKQYSFWPCSICLSSLSCSFTGFIGLLDPHCQSDSSHPYEICLILGNEDRDGTFSDIVYRPFGGPGSLTFSLVIPFAFWVQSHIPPSHPPLSLPGSFLILARVLHPSCLCSCTNNILLVTAVCVSNSTASSTHRTAQCPPLSHVFSPSMTQDHPYKILQIIVPLQLPALALMPPQSKICALSRKPSFSHWHASSAIFL
jgi:hypothetical protein